MEIAIIDTEINGETIATVNARDLHEFLGVGKVFAAWIQERIEQYGFAENIDYVVFTETGKNSSGGRPRRDYYISVDMAKELSMVERNEKGREARQYFIECERLAKRAAAQPKVIDLDDPTMLRGLLSNYAERVEVAEARIEHMQPLADAYERLDAAEGSIGLRVAAKTLDYPERKLAKWMEVNNWAFRQSGKGPLQAYAQRRKDGFLEHKINTFTDRTTGEEKASVSLMITPKGIARLAKVLPKEGGTA